MFDQLQPLAVQPAGPSAPAPAASDTQSGSSFSFHELLSELNPLQYIPVVGTIYRAVTGDVIPESARTVGSLIFSGLTGGPIGLATSVALLGLERAFGVDREQIGQQVLASIGIGQDPAAQPGQNAGAVTLEAGAASSSAPSVAAPWPAEAQSPEAWSQHQLAAYGITRTGTDTLVNGTVTGSDVLNDLVLASVSGRPGRPGAPSTVMTA